jgi:hypothetical protein
MSLEDIARDIVNGLIPADQQVPHDDVAFVLERLQAVAVDRADRIFTAGDNLASWYRFMLRYVPEDEYDDALARLDAYHAVARPTLASS